jgi:hypothetical protein
MKVREFLCKKRVTIQHSAARFNLPSLDGRTLWGLKGLRGG